MPDLNVEEYYETDSSDNEESHSKLLNSVTQLDSTQRVKPAQRKEITSNVSEYNLTEGIPGKKNLINVNELANVLRKSSKHGEITKKFKNVTSKSKTLPRPLEKPVEEQIKRSIGFENVKKQLRRWDAVVTRNALKDQLKFPLNDNSVVMQKSDEFLSQFQTSTPLEKEIMKVLNQEKIEEKQEDKEFSLTLEEMLEKRKEMAYLRARLSHREAKAQRQNKIKSKKYHRILKREKLRQQLKEFELLQKTDPEAALKKLSELDKTRAQERASLRHRNTGQWAKNLTVRAKYDVESRKILAEQLKISRELTQKVHELDDSDKEDPKEPPPWNDLKGIAKFDENPWKITISKEVQDFVSGYKKYWSEKNKTATEDSTNKSNSQEKITKKSEEICEKYSKKSEEACEKYDNKSEEACEKYDNKSEEACEKYSKKSEEVCEKYGNKNEEVCKKYDKKSEVEDCPKSNAEIQKPVESDLKKPVKNKKKSVKSKVIKISKSVNIYPCSGVWIVTPVSNGSDAEVQKKRKGGDIDTLFEELDEQLMKNAKVKVKNLKSKLIKEKKLEKSSPKRNEKVEFDLSLKNKGVVERPDMDVGLLEDDDISLETESNADILSQTIKASASVESSTDIDPEKYIQVKPKILRTHLPDNITSGEDNLDNEKKQVMTIEEAFVDDDVIAEFKEMKEETEKTKEIAIETSLPGWGEWGGLGLVPKARKNSRLFVNVPPRKDKHKKDTIIYENANPNIKNHLVKEVCHPFKSVEAFEANIRAPLGREWVPETAHWKLIQKQVETKLGAVIDPMDEDEIIRKKKTHKSPYQGKMKSQEKKI